jgi:hypothetical protein
MAKGDAPVLEALADINAVSLERTELDHDGRQRPVVPAGSGPSRVGSQQ